MNIPQPSPWETEMRAVPRNALSQATVQKVGEHMAAFLASEGPEYFVFEAMLSPHEMGVHYTLYVGDGPRNRMLIRQGTPR